MGAATASGDLTGVEMFAVGTYEQQDGTVQTYGEDYLDRVLANFRRLSAGPTPLHRVPVVVGHSGQEAYAWVKGVARARVHEGPKLVPGLKGDWVETHPALRKAVKAGRYKKVSVEFKDDFKDNQGRSYGPVLWRVAVLGADVPKVKGLADLPAEQFADKSHSKFAEVSVMDRAAAIAYLESKGVDTSAITDAIPDEFVIAVATAWQKEDAGEDTAPGGTKPDGTMADPAKPQKVTVAFSEADVARQVERAVKAALSPLQTRLTALDGKQQALDRQATHRFAEEAKKTVDAFLERMVKEKRVLPRELDVALGPKSLREVLLRTDASRVVKFSDGGKDVEKSELQLAMDAIEARLPHRFSEERVKGGTGGTADATGDPEIKGLAERTKAHFERAVARKK